MKKLLLWLTLPLLFVGCTAELESRMDGFEDRLSKLETLCSQLNTNISSLQTIVTALQNNDYVTSVTPIMKGTEEIGYTISFTKSKPITIYHGKNGADGKDGTNGKDGKSPIIGVRQAADGIYYWTVNGEWLLDSDANKIKAIGADGKDGKNGTNGQDGKDGITPQLKIVDGYWQISYDNGKTWSQIGKATGEDGDSFFKSVDTSSSDLIVFVLSDGTRIELPRYNGIIGQLQSIAYVPKYSDGVACVDCPIDGSEKTIELDFIINPSNMAEKLATSWESMVRIDLVYTQTRALVNSTSLKVLSVQCEKEYLKVIASAENINEEFFSGACGASVCLKATDGNISVSSEHIPLSKAVSYKAVNAVDLSSTESANSYIVSSDGIYKFRAVKGNSTTSVGKIAKVEVLWESFGTDVRPSAGDLIIATHSDDYIIFKATKAKGNAVIAAKDASGKILWSWHIWMTDQPEEQVYYNNAGTMMDRNLGATSATPGDVGALGLLYQWGRKDPFLGSSSITSGVIALSTGKWDIQQNGNPQFTVENPTTFYMTRHLMPDESWNTIKTINDPCPAGWRVPDIGVWAKAAGSSSFNDQSLYDSVRKGNNLSGKYGASSMIWYPMTGILHARDGQLSSVGEGSYYWSVSHTYPYTSSGPYSMRIGIGYVSTYQDGYRSFGNAVRCCKESDAAMQSYNNLSEQGTANSYIVSEQGKYKFEAVQGNSFKSVGTVSSVEVLWETFGTDVKPNIGDLVKNVSYRDGYILFEATNKKGNASIAAKDASGKILWSWHIWMTNQPKEHEYYNNAGTMMDRNLGATSAEPGKVEALGLLYQWGRKDPFLGGSAIYSSSSIQAKAASTLSSWPAAVTSDASNGTIANAQANPTTFIKYNSSNGDWYYTGTTSTDNTRWLGVKTIYDPCPPGWRVPYGGSNGVWSKALGSSSSFKDQSLYNSTTRGFNFSGKFGDSSMIWYPTAGCLGSNSGQLGSVGGSGSYWSVASSSYYAYSLYFGSSGGVSPSDYLGRAHGQSVRCCKE